jgi:BirA family biotin operon repressor/biotin-[acetyl-CoA-carboxylase] ligase
MMRDPSRCRIFCKVSDMYKNEILRMLRSSGSYVSGQELCRELGISRTAVWKNIRQLEEDGYEIEASAGKGYRITGFPDTIAEEEVASILQTERMGKKIRYFSRIDSTNQYAKRIAEEGAEDGTLVIADEQTAGKGRSGRHWVTPPGEAIAFTLLLRPPLSPDRISMVTLVMGMAVAEAFRSLYDLPAGIKWPNDIVTGGRKLCGILTEMSAEVQKVHYIVIGVGINANMCAFPDEISQIATSLKIETGQDVNRAQIIARTMECFERCYAVFEKDGDLSGLMDDYNALLINRGKVVRVLDPAGEYSGTALGINRRGELIVRRDDGTECSVYAGEVSVRGVYGYV